MVLSDLGWESEWEVALAKAVRKVHSLEVALELQAEQWDTGKHQQVQNLRDRKESGVLLVQKLG